MLYKTLVAVGLASVAAENCGGALSIDPRYCIGSPDGVNPYCNAQSLQDGDTVPLRIRMTNNANYENLDADTVYVPGELQARKQIQIVFACLGGTSCATASDVLTFSGTTVWDDDIGGAGADASFAMGPCSDFDGVDLCTALDNKNVACGCITLPSTPVAMLGDEEITVGQIMMTASSCIEKPFTVHISADEGMLITTGAICQPDELTASGTGTAQAECTALSPPPPPPPPSPPPPPKESAACICVGGVTHGGLFCASYGKCHWCDEALPEGACFYDGAGESCKSSCDDLAPSSLYTKRWGACSSWCPVSASKDPHLHLPHGGRADFRGQEDTVFNLLSAKNVAFNVLFEKGDFAWATRLVHGTKMAAGYWVVKTKTGKTLNIEYTAQKFDPVAIVREDEHRDVSVRQGTPALVVDDVIVSMVGKTLTVRNTEWLFTATTSAYPFGKLEMNKNKVLLDVSVQPLYNPDTDPVAPHGILGQAYDQDNLAVEDRKSVV